MCVASVHTHVCALFTCVCVASVHVCVCGLCSHMCVWHMCVASVHSLCSHMCVAFVHTCVGHFVHTTCGTLFSHVCRRFPFDQTTGGNLYRHHAPPIPFSCNTLLQDPSLRRRSCHATSGPCRECVRKMFPCPAFVFPFFDCRPPSSPLAASISSLDPHLDVFTSKALVSPATTSFLRDKLDKLGLSRKNSPAPKYHNIIDPNVGSVDGVWVPTDVSVSGVYVRERSKWRQASINPSEHNEFTKRGPRIPVPSRSFPSRAVHLRAEPFIY